MIEFRERWIERENCSVAAAVIGAVGSVVGGVIQGHAAKTAAGQETQAIQQGIGAEQGFWNQVQGYEAPFQQAGLSDLTQFNQFMSGSNAQKMAMLQGMPGYQFALTQGLKAVQNSASARGLGVSGAAQKGAAAYATGLATENWQSFINPLLQGAQIGQNAAGQLALAGAGFGQNIASLYGNIGQARAAGTVGAANALSGGIAGIGQNLMLANLFGGGGMFGGGGSGAVGGGQDFITQAAPATVGALNNALFPGG